MPKNLSSRILAGTFLALLLAGSAAGFAAGSVELVSRANPRQLSDTAGGSARGLVFNPPSISADGRWIAFLSGEQNLVTGQRSGALDPRSSQSNIFLRDRVSGSTVLVSHAVDSAATTANRGATKFALSADGRWVAFISASTDLVAGQTDDTTFHPDCLFLYDRVSGATSLVSPSTYVEENNRTGVRQIAISADGRFIAFTSDAPDLVPGQQDDNNYFDVFLYDRTARTTALVSHIPSSTTTAGNNGGTEYLSISADGRWIAFDSPATDLVPEAVSGVFLYDRLSSSLRRVGPGNRPAISADGSSVLFFSASSQVVPGQVDGNGDLDVFLYNRAAGTTALVSHAAGQPATTGNGAAVAPFNYGSTPLLSADGRYALFISTATNLVPGQVARSGGALFLYDRVTGAVTLASPSGSSATTPGSFGQVQSPSISADGRWIAYESRAQDQVPGQIDTPSTSDVFLFDRTTGKTVLVSSANGSLTQTGNGGSGSPILSAGGSQVAYYSEASNLAAGVKDFNGGSDAVAYDVASRTNAYLSLHAPDQPSLSPDAASALRGVSGDGRWVLFESTATNLAAGQIDANERTDVFLYDHATHSVLLASRRAGSAAAAGDDESTESVLSADGRYVAFTSKAANLVAGITDPIDPATGQPVRKSDVFLFDRTTGAVTAVSRSATHAGLTADNLASTPAISADGRWVAFVSNATDLVSGVTDDNETGDVYLWDRVTGANILVSRSSADPSRSAHGFSGYPVLSADGRYVAYESEATDLVPGQTGNLGFLVRAVFLFDRVTGTTILASHSPGSTSDAAMIFAADLPSISADGRYVLFSSYRTDLGDVPGRDVSYYLFDRVSGAISWIGWTYSNNTARNPTLSADGRWAAFLSNGEDLVPGTYNGQQSDQLYLWDRVSKTLTLVTPSLTLSGQTSQGFASNPSLSADGRYLAFESNAADLVPGQTGTGRAVFLYDRVKGTRTVVGRSPYPFSNETGRLSPRISANGQAVAFESTSPDLVTGDSNARNDVFLYTAAGSPGGPVTVPPCNLFSGVLRSNKRTVLKAAGSCGVPAGAKQVTVKLTVSQGTGKGNVQLYPGNVTAPASGILRFDRGATRTAPFTLPLSTNGTGTIALLPNVAGNGTIRVAVEVNGYTP